jgi:hypothetical protein
LIAARDDRSKIGRYVGKFGREGGNKFIGTIKNRDTVVLKYRKSGGKIPLPLMELINVFATGICCGNWN